MRARDTLIFFFFLILRRRRREVRRDIWSVWESDTLQRGEMVSQVLGSNWIFWFAMYISITSDVGFYVASIRRLIMWKWGPFLFFILFL